MTTPNPQEDNSWRRHEVPTYTEAQDTWLFGLSFRQLIAIAIGAGVGYAVYQILWFLGLWYRIGAGGVVVVFASAFIAVKPGGRSLFVVLFELISYQFRSRHYSDLVRHIVATGPIDQFRPQRKRRTLTIPIPTPSNTIYIRMRLPIGGRRGAAKAVALALLASVMFGSVGCFSFAEAQDTGHYIGKRVYLQSTVLNYRLDSSAGGSAATLRMKAAAPLRWAEPRVLESLQSPTERRAQGTTFEPAIRFAASEDGGSYSRITATYGIPPGEEFAFWGLLLFDSRLIRPYCDIPLESGHVRNIGGGEDGIFFRHHSNDCRIIQPKDLADNQTDVHENGVGGEYSISRPNIIVEWEDIKRSKGALAISGSSVPWPAPSLYKLEQELENSGAELLNPFELCDPRELKILSLGIQSSKPIDHGDEDYFEGAHGKVLAGEVEVCGLEKGDRMASIGLPEMPVFAAGDENLEIKLRPLVTTLDPEFVVNRATIVIRDLKTGDTFGNPAGYKVPKSEDDEYDASKPNTVKFVGGVGAGALFPKLNAGELDTARFQVEVVVEHIVTVKRPEYQPIQGFDRKIVDHITSCRCRCTVTCSSSSGSTRSPIIYWEPHFRVDDMDRQYLFEEMDSDTTLRFTQTYTFEATYVSFDKPYESLVYAEPTPRAGRQREPDYYNEGDSLGYYGGFSTGTELACSAGVGSVDGDPTSWIWIAPGVNSQGEAYGGCRKNFVCKLHVPPQEEIFGAGGIPTEDDYDCVEYRYGD